MRLDRLGDRAAETVAVNGQRATGRDRVFVALGHDQRTRQAQLSVDHTDSIGLGVIRAEGIGADQLGQLVGLVGVGGTNALIAHLVQDHALSGLRSLPRGFRAGQSAADDMECV
ncbi:MAG: Uncharacterised protein [Rhodospirillaceae bacterium]|nr:MAG: Uncharacterised protein [Rhodospirillaceae bacterium]